MKFFQVSNKKHCGKNHITHPFFGLQHCSWLFPVVVTSSGLDFRWPSPRTLISWEKKELRIIRKVVQKNICPKLKKDQCCHLQNCIHFYSEVFRIASCMTTALIPIPTGQERNQPLYEHHVTKSGRNRVKTILKIHILCNQL